MSVAGNQQRTLLQLLAQLRPHWHSDRNLPARVQVLLSRNRSFGSRDRRLYRELVYTALRFLPWVESALEHDPEHATRIIAWLASDSPATESYRRTLISEWPACPPSVSGKAEILNSDSVVAASRSNATRPFNFRSEDLLPDWIHAECPEALTSPTIDVLHMRGPLWLRCNRRQLQEITSEFDQLGWRWRAAATLPNAIEVLDAVDVTKSASFAAGMFEVQDLGSQLLLESAGIEPGQRWLDACAGAGGKTLQLAQLLGPTGSIDASDIRRAALAELSVRAHRAHLNNVSVLERPPAGEYDGVLVDAPCTGSGTWRRAPHLKWTTGTPQIADAARTQRTLLANFSTRVRWGGRLLYATCSLNQSENEAVVAEFLAEQSDFFAEPARQSFGGIVRGDGLTFLPALHNTDGFFIAAFRRQPKLLTP